MMYAGKSRDQRRESRVNITTAIQISIGSQLTLQGVVRDLSLKSAFVIMKAGAYLKMNDEIGFVIPCASGKEDNAVSGMARISRLAPGEGVAIYFTRLDGNSEKRLRKMTGA